jgi:antitoxin FitA
MAQLVVRNLDDDVKARLKEKAARYKIPLEALVREILLEAALKDEPDVGVGSQAAALFKGIGLKKHERLPEFRGSVFANPFEGMFEDEDEDETEDPK